MADLTNHRALTLHPHWAHAVTHLGKRIENRKRPIPEALIGRRIAIHAGATLPRGWIADLRKHAAVWGDDGRRVRGEPRYLPTAGTPDGWCAPVITRAIVATARLRGLVLRPTGAALDDLWWRYGDTKIALGTRVNRASKAGRNAHALPASRAGFTTITDGHAHLGQSRFGDHLPSLARLRVGRVCPPDLGALDELVKAGRVREPSLAFPGWVALAKHRKRVERIEASYGPQSAGDLPLFAGRRA